MTKQSTVKTTYFLVKVVQQDERPHFLSYDDYFNGYRWEEETTKAERFATQEEAERVAHFYQEIAVRNQMGEYFTYSLHQEEVTITEVPLETRDYSGVNEEE